MFSAGICTSLVVRSTGQSQILRQLGRFETTRVFWWISDIKKYHFFSGATMPGRVLRGGGGSNWWIFFQFNGSMCECWMTSSPLIHPEVANAVWEIRGSAMSGAQLPPSFRETYHLSMMMISGACWCWNVRTFQNQKKKTFPKIRLIEKNLHHLGCIKPYK